MVFFFRSLAVVLFLISSPLSASKELCEIAYIDDHYVVRESLVFKDISKQIEEHRVALKSKFSNEENQLREMESSIVQQMHMLSEEAYKNKIESYRNEMSVVQKEAHNMKQKLDEAYAKAIRTVQTELNSIITKIAQERKLSLIASKSNFVYVSDESIDVTKQVLQLLDERMSSLKVQVDGIDFSPSAKKDQTALSATKKKNN